MRAGTNVVLRLRNSVPEGKTKIAGINENIANLKGTAENSIPPIALVVFVPVFRSVKGTEGSEGNKEGIEGIQFGLQDWIHAVRSEHGLRGSHGNLEGTFLSALSVKGFAGKVNPSGGGSVEPTHEPGWGESPLEP